MPRITAHPLAIDVALLPPADVMRTAIDINAALPPQGFQGLRLDDQHLPHVTLTQHFISAARVDDALRAVGEIAAREPALPLRVLGPRRSGSSGGSGVWMEVEKTGRLAAIHHAVMEALQSMEISGGGAAPDRTAFVNGDARPGDVAWVASFRAKASFGAFIPHITLGHSTSLPALPAIDFVAHRLAVCHLGRFCSCQQILGEWSLS